MRAANDEKRDEVSITTLKNVEVLDDFNLDFFNLLDESGMVRIIIKTNKLEWQIYLPFFLFEDDANPGLHTPLLDSLPLNFPQMTKESIQTAENTDWSAMSAPPKVTGQYRASASVENTDGPIVSVKFGSRNPDILQEVVRISNIYEENPGPSGAPPAEPERDTDHTYTLLLASPGLETKHYIPIPVLSTEPAYANTTSVGSVDSQWKMIADEAPAPQAELTCVVEDIKGCSTFSKLQNLHHIVSSGKFSFTASVKG